MGLVETADADPAHPRQFVVATASFVFCGRPAVHFAEEVHQLQGSLDGRGGIRPCVAAFFALPPLNSLPSPHHAAYFFRIHGDRIPESARELPPQQRPKVALINGRAGSGGNAFPYYFKELGPWTLVGTRTRGGLAGLSGNPRRRHADRAHLPRPYLLGDALSQWGLPPIAFHSYKT
jgi:hypothetical protein